MALCQTRLTKIPLIHFSHVWVTPNADILALGYSEEVPKLEISGIAKSQISHDCILL